MADETKNIKRYFSSHYIQWLQVVLYLSSSVFSIITSVTLFVVYEDLDKECPFYAKPGPKDDDPVLINTDSNGTHYLLIKGIKFEDAKTCLYTIYLNATASIWGLLFSILSSRPTFKSCYLRKMVFPSLMFNSVMFTCQLISCCVLTLGFTHWCSSLVEKTKQSAEKQNIQITCSILQGLPWQYGDKQISYIRGQRFFALLTLAQIASWLLSLTSLVLSVICAERFLKSVWNGTSNNYELNNNYDDCGEETSQRVNSNSENKQFSNNMFDLSYQQSANDYNVLGSSKKVETMEQSSYDQSTKNQNSTNLPHLQHLQQPSSNSTLKQLQNHVAILSEAPGQPLQLLTGRQMVTEFPVFSEQTLCMPSSVLPSTMFQSQIHTISALSNCQTSEVIVPGYKQSIATKTPILIQPSRSLKNNSNRTNNPKLGEHHDSLPRQLSNCTGYSAVLPEDMELISTV